MLTQKDLDEIEKLIDDKFDEKLRFLPTKDEFFERMDKLIGEIKASREEHTVISGQLTRHSDILEKHEKRIETTEKTISSRTVS